MEITIDGDQKQWLCWWDAVIKCVSCCTALYCPSAMCDATEQSVSTSMQVPRRGCTGEDWEGISAP
eukprot:939080-Rhodomonas_salina.1